MKLLKKNIQMLQKKTRGENQLTFDEDINVPDSRPDIRRMIQKKGEILIEEVLAADEMAHITGFLHFQLLYVADTPSGEIASLDGKVPVSETLHLEGMTGGDKVSLKWEIEDLTLHMINSRKLNLKAVAGFEGYVEQNEEVSLPVDIANGKDAAVRTRQVQLLTLGVHKKDTMRKKEKLVIPQNKPDIQEILWSELLVQGMEMRAGEGEITVAGEISCFALYKGDDEGESIEWIEKNIPFNGSVPCPGCTSEMIPKVKTTVLQGSIEAKPDVDGEQRELLADVVLELDMTLYKEDTEKMITDVYSPSVECIVKTQTVELEQLLIKNNSKCRVDHKFSVEGAKGKILQICHSDGSVKVDRIEVADGGIQIQGVVSVRILYCISDDDMPFYSMDTMVPFEHRIQTEGIDKNCVYRLTAEIESLSTVMLDSNEIGIRIVLKLDALVLRTWKEEIIQEIGEKELDMEKLEKMPGIVCYMVKPEDSLWDIARHFYTTVDSIREINDLEEEKIYPGQPLLVVKKADG